MRFPATYVTDLFSEAVAAVNGAVGSGLEGNLASLSARRADSVEHRTCRARRAGLAFFGVTAVFAALRFVGESFFGVKFLLAGSEGEIVTAIAANQSFVFVHTIPLKKLCCVTCTNIRSTVVLLYTLYA